MGAQAGEPVPPKRRLGGWAWEWKRQCDKGNVGGAEEKRRQDAGATGGLRERVAPRRSGRAERAPPLQRHQKLTVGDRLDGGVDQGGVVEVGGVAGSFVGD